MKRVHLDPLEVRPAAVALLRFAVNDHKGRKPGDPVHEWVTERRRKHYEDALRRGEAWAVNMKAGYHSCGDGMHWLLMCLGVREPLINRGDDGGEKPWLASLNILMVQQLPGYRSVRPQQQVSLLPGDILHVAAPVHVMGLVSLDEEAGLITTADYGSPHGQLHTRKFARRNGVIYIGDRVLQGYVDIDRVPRVDSALVPLSFDGGTEDDNPYLEDLGEPPGVG